MRKLAVLACATLVGGAIAVGGAAAMTTPASGAVTCGVTGTETLKPGIPATMVAPATKAISAKVHMATLACDATGVTGGKAAITGGVVMLNAKLAPGASCDTLLTSLGSVEKAVLMVKLTSTTVDPVTLASTTRTVAVARPKGLVVTQSGNGVHITGTVQQSASGNKPFGGETIDVQLNVDNDVTACTAGTTALDHIDFSTAGGSSVSIHP